MSRIIHQTIRHMFRTVLDWDLVKKSQAILVYTICMKFGFYLLLLIYQNHPLIDSTISFGVRGLLLGLIIVNGTLLLTGHLLRKHHRWHQMYSLVVMIYYVLSMLVIPIMIGVMNVVNGLILLMTITVTMIFFPKMIMYSVMSVFAVGYACIIVLINLGYLDYGLIFHANVLIHPQMVNLYMNFSILYALIYLVISLCLFALCIEAWREKLYGHDLTQYRDQDTQLLNKCGLRQVLALQLQQAFITKAELSMVILDIDNFKRVLEQYGHEYEHTILMHVVNVLRNNLRASDTIARYDIEQFVLVLAHTPLERAENVAEMCRETLEKSILNLGVGQPFCIKASFGVSSTAYNDFEFSLLLDSAQKALELAKESGKNQVCSVDVVSHP